MINVHNMFKGFSVCEVSYSTGMKMTYSRIRFPRRKGRCGDLVLVYKYYDDKPCSSMTMSLEEAKMEILMSAIEEGNLKVDGVTYKFDTKIEKKLKES